MSISVRQGDWRRGAFSLSLAVAIHLGMLCWTVAFRNAIDQPRSKAPDLTVTFVKPTAPTIATIPAKPGTQRKPSNNAAARPSPADRNVTAPTAAEATPIAPEQPSADEMVMRARRQAGQIDRDLRRSFPHASSSAIPAQASGLEKGIAAAAVSRDTTMQTMTLHDGRTITRVTGPSGSYCIVSDAAAGGNGSDPLQAGRLSKVTTCPN